MEIQSVHRLLQKEFEAEAEVLYETFCEADERFKGFLKGSEQRYLMQLIDPDASEEDVSTYVQEINADASGLGFLDLLDWWEQAKEVPQSLVNKNEQRLVSRLRQR